MAPTVGITRGANILAIPNGTNGQWWCDSGLRRLVFWQACILVTQMTAGYDGSVVGNFQAMDPWIEGTQELLTI